MADYAAARHNMVENQIRPNKVTDPRIITAMAGIPRELFVPEESRGIAYVDEDIPVGKERFLMEPRVLARLLQCAEIEKTDVVLDIGCGTGYSAAVLAELANTVVALESDRELAAAATKHCEQLGIDNAVVIEAELDAGYGEQAPYDVIFFDGAVQRIPENICEQLTEGGRLAAVVDDGAGLGRATLVLRRGGVLSRRLLFDAATPRLPGFSVEPGFVF